MTVKLSVTCLIVSFLLSRVLNWMVRLAHSIVVLSSIEDWLFSDRTSSTKAQVVLTS